MNDSKLEEAIQEKGLTAARVTLDHINATIVGEDYYVFPGTTVTVCLLKLRNGFNVVDHSACVSPANFDAELGRKIARERAVNQIWALEGYALAERIYGSS